MKTKSKKSYSLCFQDFYQMVRKKVASTNLYRILSHGSQPSEGLFRSSFATPDYPQNPPLGALSCYGGIRSHLGYPLATNSRMPSTVRAFRCFPLREFLALTWFYFKCQANTFFLFPVSFNILRL